MYDVCIVGGGFAGLAAAITVGGTGRSAVIIDKNPKLGRKIYATGNGKCNLTNLDMSINNKYHSSAKDYGAFLSEVMSDDPCGSVCDFMLDLGVPTYNKNGYIYPASMQASSVAWAMLDRVKSSGIDIRCKEECINIIKNDEAFQIITSKDIIHSGKVIVACGGASYPSLGGSDKGYRLAESLGDKLVPIRPALCGVTTDSELSGLAGVRVPACATVLDGNGTVSCECGELQITDKALSGIIIFNLSSVIGRSLSDNQNCSISFNFLNGMTKSDIKKLCGCHKYRTVIGLFNGFINDRLVSYAAGMLKISRDTLIGELSIDDTDRLIRLLSDMKFHVTGLTGYDHAQVCAGGVALSGINFSSCESISTRGLYYAGEIIDIDGACGGYNISFAILSGIRAGEACI